MEINKYYLKGVTDAIFQDLADNMGVPEDSGVCVGSKGLIEIFIPDGYVVYEGDELTPSDTERLWSSEHFQVTEETTIAELRAWMERELVEYA